MNIPGNILNLYGGAMPEIKVKEVSVLKVVMACAGIVALVYLLKRHEKGWP